MFPLLGSVGLLLGCATLTAPSVERAEQGRRWEGRYIPVESYAWFARGVSFEARGDLAQAEAAYIQAATSDPESGSIWAHIGAVRCARSAKDADEAFDQALDTENDGAVVLTMRARCALAQRRWADALDDGRAAVEREPASIPANLVVVDALVGLARAREAEQWLDALVARYPGALAAQERRRTLAHERGDAFRERRATEALEPEADAALLTEGREALDQALMSDDLELARERAIQLEIPGAVVALRAVALGKTVLGLKQAELVLRAAPDDADARIAELVALERAGNADALSAAIAAPLPEGAAELHPLAALLFGELLENRSGSVAAAAWRAAHPIEPSQDPLVERLRLRLLGTEKE